MKEQRKKSLRDRTWSESMADFIPAMTLLFITVAIVLVFASSVGVSRYNHVHPATRECTLESASVFKSESDSSQRQATIYFHTTDCGKIKYRGFNYQMEPDALEQTLNSRYRGQKISFSVPAIDLLPQDLAPAHRFAVGELDYRTWSMQEH